MEKKVKFLFIGLGGLLAVSLLFLISTIGSKQALLREYTSTKERLTRENEALVQKANAALEDKRRLEERLLSIQKDLDRVSQEKDEIQKKYELAIKEREELIEKLKLKKPEAEARPPAVTEDAYWAKILREKAGLETQVSNLKNELDNLRMVLEEAKRDKAAMELEIKNLNRDKQNLENRVIYNDKVTDSLSSELVREKNDKRQLQDELKALKSEHAVLLRQLKTLNNQKASLEARLREAEQAKAALDKRIKDMNEMLEYKLSQVMDVKKDLEQIQEGAKISPPTSKSYIELPPIVVRSGGVTQPAPTIYKGKVLAVNKENNFIIIDLGEEEGLKPGVNFDVYHDNTKIATVEVIQTRKNVSACDIKQASTTINVGDLVQ